MDENCHLTDRQRDMLRAIVPGLKNGSITARNSISPSLGGIQVSFLSLIQEETIREYWDNMTLDDMDVLLECGFLIEVPNSTSAWHKLSKGKIIHAVENDFYEKKSNSYLSLKVEETAYKLVEAQENDEIDNEFELINVTSGSGKTRREYARGLGIEESVDIPNINHLADLAYYGLVEFEKSLDKVKVRLLPPLRQSVESDFQAPPPLRANTIIGQYFASEATFNAPVSNAGVVYGDVIQTIPTNEIAANLVKILGEQLLSENESLRQSIIELGEAHDEDEPTRRQKLMNVIKDLGGGMHTMAAFGGTIEAMKYLVSFFG
ncbi:MAG: hypothetical protein ACPG7F_03380 [Aggregatilineales bacterium]